MVEIFTILEITILDSIKQIKDTAKESLFLQTEKSGKADGKTMTSKEKSDKQMI